MIQANKLTRLYGDFAAVDQVSFTIQPGEVVGLLGPNGAGKTTIMRMLTGALEPSAGQALVDNVVVEEAPQAVQAALGYLPENLPLYPELGVTDYLAYVARLRRLADVPAAVRRAISATGLEEKALASIDTLSRGYRQRVGVAQAILHQPRFLILDEPTNGLDPGQTQQMRQLIRRLAESATVILSTHIMQEVNAVCDRVLILRNGALVVDERLETLQQTDALLLRTSPEAKVAELLPGAELSSAGHWRLPVDGSLDSAAQEATARLVGAAAPVYEVRPEQRNLETLFREVSEGA